MRSRWPEIAAVVLAAVTVAVKVLTLVVAPAGDSVGAGAATTSLGPFLDIGLFTCVQLLYLALACLLVARRPRHPITWLMVAIVLNSVLGGLSEAVTAQAHGSPEPWWWYFAAWFRTWYFAAFVSAFALLFHLFPTGRAIPGRLVWGTRAAFLATALVIVVVMFGPADSGPANPLEVATPALVDRVSAALLAIAWPVAVLTIVPILVVRFRRSRGEERQQLKWFLFCGTVALGVFWLQWLADWMFLVAIVLPAIGIGGALLRHGLYDIDRIISRTTSYAVVTGLLLATYGLVVTTISWLPGTESSLAVAAATLAAAALVRPALRRIQENVDRRFNRSRYDAIRTIDDFGTRLRQQVDPTLVSQDLVDTVNTALQPNHVGIWIRQPTAVSVQAPGISYGSQSSNRLPSGSRA